MRARRRRCVRRIERIARKMRSDGDDAEPGFKEAYGGGEADDAEATHEEGSPVVHVLDYCACVRILDV